MIEKEYIPDNPYYDFYLHVKRIIEYKYKGKYYSSLSDIDSEKVRSINNLVRMYDGKKKLPFYLNPNRTK